MPSTASSLPLRRAALCLLFAAALPAAALAATPGNPGIRLYRYVDSRGVTVMSTQGVPSEYIAKGYQVLNQQGRVIQTVPPAPTADELKAQQTQAAQSQQDQALLQNYRSLADLDREKTRRLAEADAQVGLANNNLLVLKQQQDSLQGQAAGIERNGQPVPAALVQQIDAVRKQQDAVTQQIAATQQNKLALAAQFDQQRARLAELLGQ
ncbi:DUF4124 domain-containing protein [Pseudomonas sp. NPDC007930]|uniref:DUF4124 domain-containing protein n=1 Tax=Pseudomonas sp. NPDC007930 TaxID=3364417 RepID=UPI0036F16BB5